MTNRAKFMRYYGTDLQLRVEQIGPDLWVGSVYYSGQAPDESVQPSDRWDVFTALTEESAKDAVLATAFNRIGPVPDNSDKDWRRLSDVSDENWSKSIVALGFPGYPDREGIERWDGF